MTSPLCPKAECVLPPGHKPGHSFVRSASPDELHAFHRRVREWVALAVEQIPDTAGLKDLEIEMKVRLHPNVFNRPNRPSGRTNNAYHCGYDAAWRGDSFSGVYSPSCADFSRAERAGYEDGLSDVRAAIDAARGAK